MNKEDFLKILCSYTPEELNKFISEKGKIKRRNLVTIIDKTNKESFDNGKCKRGH